MFPNDLSVLAGFAEIRVQAVLLFDTRDCSR